MRSKGGLSGRRLRHRPLQAAKGHPRGLPGQVSAIQLRVSAIFGRRAFSYSIPMGDNFWFRIGVIALGAAPILFALYLMIHG